MAGRWPSILPPIRAGPRNRPRQHGPRLPCKKRPFGKVEESCTRKFHHNTASENFGTRPRMPHQGGAAAATGLFRRFASNQHPRRSRPQTIFGFPAIIFRLCPQGGKTRVHVQKKRGPAGVHPPTAQFAVRPGFSRTFASATGQIQIIP